MLMFRIMKEDLDIKREDLFPCAKLTSARGHNLKVNNGKPAYLENEIRRRFYSQRVVVPQHIVECDSVDSFKMNYDRCRWCGKVSC